jgi:chromosome segregation ATPase
MTEAQLNELRSRVAALEEQDADFARRSNLLLDEILITDENLKILTRRVDALTERVDTLTERVDSLFLSQENTQATVAQLATLMVQFAQNAETDRQTFQTEIRRIWEYLLERNPNGGSAAR